MVNNYAVSGHIMCAEYYFYAKPCNYAKYCKRLINITTGLKKKRLYRFSVQSLIRIDVLLLGDTNLLQNNKKSGHSAEH